MPSLDKLVLLSTNFPDGDSFESNFLNPELPHLLSEFKEVHLLPSKPVFNPPESLPPGATTHLDLADCLGFPAKHKLLFHAIKGLQVQSRFPALCNSDKVIGLSTRKLADLANLGMAFRVFELLDQGIRNGRWPVEETLFYTYWCKYTALGLAWLRTQHPKLKAIARAHRGDLYPEEAPYSLVTRQTEIIKGMDHIYVISKDGAGHLRKHFPDHKDKIQVARLGTHALNRRAHASNDGTLRIVSCSSATPVKRLHLIAEAAMRLAQEEDKKVEWTHFGDGPELSAVKKLCAESASTNLSCQFSGNTALEKILEHYTQQSVDVLINSSRSEGIPVSMMEAMSAGIPCIAPSVGGIPELLQEDSGGELISPDATPQEIADACLRLTSDREAWIARSNQAFESWSKNYSADNNFSRFARAISSL